MIKTIVNRIKGLLEEAVLYNNYLKKSNDSFINNENNIEDNVFVKARRGQTINREELYNESLKHTEHTLLSSDFNTVLIQLASLYEVFKMELSEQTTDKDAQRELSSTYFGKEQLTMLDELQDRTSRTMFVSKKLEVVYKDEDFKKAIKEQVQDTTDKLINTVIRK